MNEIVAGTLLLVGSLFMLIASLGVLRMPDLLMRMHSSTKAGTLGIGCVFLAIAAYYQELGVTTRALAAMSFMILTAPVGAHVIGRAAYFLGVPLWKGTFTDELRQAHLAQERPGALPESSDRNNPNN
ncbi:MAG: Na+/H+ antiporter subunit G [Bdellovibrionales bacterium GWB1_55_8]|nr:MAG: Na+/H+ antiporter subunit G [Bdellovibrionales bacterium GWB1_55_8]